MEKEIKKINILTFASISLIVLANLVEYVGTLLVYSQIRGPKDFLFSFFAIINNSVLKNWLEIIAISVFIIFSLGGLAFIIQIRQRKKMGLPFGKSFVATIILLFFSLPLLRVSIGGAQLLFYRLLPSAGPVQMETNIDKWKDFTSQKDGFSAKLPPKLVVKESGADLSSNIIEYNTLVPVESTLSMGKYEPFQLVLSTILNKDGLSVEDYRDASNREVKAHVKHYEILSSSPVTVDGIEGIKDDVLINGPDGWRCYSRILIPHKDRIFVIKGILGVKKEVFGYRKIFNSIVSTFEIEK